MSVLFGYQHVAEIPLCPCGDCGSLASLEQPGDDPLKVVFRSWCGRQLPATFDSMAERSDFLARYER